MVKQFKYWVKATVLSRRPGWYWRARKIFRGPLEPELELVSKLSTRGGVFLDVGASWGAYSYEALVHGFVVHAFEPQPRVAGALRRGLPGIVVHCVAVSDRAGEVEIRVPRDDIGYATIEARNALHGTADLSRGIAREPIRTVRLDDLELGRITLIKIDVEGHEEAVLLGAVATLARDQPALIVELEERHHPGSRSRVRELLEARGYQAFCYQGVRLVPAPENSALPRNLVFMGGAREPVSEPGVAR
jgi:FkbM family methyltransferase